jgi:hypothetical protein
MVQPPFLPGQVPGEWVGRPGWRRRPAHLPLLLPRTVTVALPWARKSVTERRTPQQRLAREEEPGS